MKTILAAVDSSGASELVANETLALAAAGASVRVVLLTVVQPPVITSEYAPMIENLAEITTAGEKAAARHLKRMQDRFQAAEIPVTAVQRTGGPIAHILQQAEEHQADYIVMGSHGHTAFYDLLVGSTTHGVLLRASCPVVIVPPKKQRERHKIP